MSLRCSSPLVLVMSIGAVSQPGSAWGKVRDVPAPLDPILRNRHFVLSEHEDGYGIWRRDGGDPIEVFPDPEAFDDAAARFRLLTRAARLEALQGSAGTRLRWVFAAGIVLWIVGGLLVTVGTFAGYGEAGYIAGWILDSLGFRLTVGAFLGILIVRFLGPGGAIAAGAPARWLRRPSGRALAWGGGVALAVWIPMAVVTQLLLRYEHVGLAPRRGSIVASAIETLAFRVWVGAALVLWLLDARERLREANERADAT